MSNALADKVYEETRVYIQNSVGLSYYYPNDIITRLNKYYDTLTKDNAQSIWNEVNKLCGDFTISREIARQKWWLQNCGIAALIGVCMTITGGVAEKYLIKPKSRFSEYALCMQGAGVCTTILILLYLH